MWPFGRSALLDDETAEWHVDNFEWLLERFGADGAFAASRLVLPDAFEVEGLRGVRLADVLFARVKELCGMSDWPVELLAQPETADIEPNPALGSIATGGAAGMFVADGDGVAITYDPRQLRDPPSLVGTFAHELAHYLLATEPERPTSEPDEEEFLTDLAACFLGFGVFMANGAFSTATIVTETGTGSGWSRKGYLPQDDLLFDVALYVAAHGDDPADAARGLKPHMRKPFDRALRQVAGDGRMRTMRERVAKEKERL